MNETLFTGNGKVMLLSGGGKVFTDIAARFVGSERELEDIASSEYNRDIVKNIIKSGHLAATEFDYFIFGIEGYSRVTEIQLVRKRLASYLIKSGRINKGGKRKLTTVLPRSIINFKANIEINNITHLLGAEDIVAIVNQWYEAGVAEGLPEEDLRYVRPQGTEMKAIIGMNAHALLDWFKIRTCLLAQNEIRDLATKMMRLCKDVAPDLFIEAGASCVSLGYCPENGRQHKNCVGKVYTKDEALSILKSVRKTAL